MISVAQNQPVCPSAQEEMRAIQNQPARPSAPNWDGPVQDQPLRPSAGKLAQRRRREREKIVRRGLICENRTNATTAKPIQS